MERFVYFLKKILFVTGTILAVILMVAAVVICSSIRWMFDTWSNLTMDELVYHLTAPLEGTNGEMIAEYLSVCVAPAILIMLLAVVLFVAWHDKKKRYFVLMGGGMAVSLTVSAVSVHGAWNKLDVGNYVADQGTYSTFIDDNYVDPADVSLKFPERKRNLIYIFLESMETTYADKESGGAFDQNVIPELTRLAQENEDFSGTDPAINGGYAMPGATWTIAAMFSETSGIPLSISIEDNSMDTQDSFFASAITLGDILEQAGYTQSLLIGSDATFGGRRLYFTEHGNFDILDYMYARDTQRIPEDYRVWWGYEDQKLFEFAKERVTELAAGEQPFNLTMLTVDTHFEDGYPCQICRNTYGDDQYSNVMACSSRQVDRFVKWVQQQDFYENTTIVLIGDHPTMDSDFCEDVDGEYVRRVYTSYINSAVGVATDTKRVYTTFDNFPTTLASLGVEIEGERLGLGTNLFSGKQTLTERFGLDYQKRQIGRKSELMERLADLDENKRELLVREGEFADITVGEYDIVTGVIPIEVRDIANIPEGVESVQMAVWTAGDQSDLQWIQMGMQEDGSYLSQINVPSFGYKSGEYRVHVYVVDRTGAQYLVGAVQAYVR
mgnify:FL=1